MNSINLINQYKKFKKDIEERFLIPFHYVLFGVLLIILYLNIPDEEDIPELEKEKQKLIERGY